MLILKLLIIIIISYCCCCYYYYYCYSLSNHRSTVNSIFYVIYANNMQIHHLNNSGINNANCKA